MLVVNSEQYCQIEKPIVVAPAMNTCMFEVNFLFYRENNNFI